MANTSSTSPSGGGSRGLGESAARLFTRERFGSCEEGIVEKITLLHQSGGWASICTYGGILLGMGENEDADVILGFDTFKNYIDHPEPYFGGLIGRCCGRVGWGQLNPSKRRERETHTKRNGDLVKEVGARDTNEQEEISSREKADDSDVECNVKGVGAGTSETFIQNSAWDCELPRNSGEHHLHGGAVGFDKRLWKASVHRLKNDGSFGDPVEQYLRQNERECEIEGPTDEREREDGVGLRLSRISLDGEEGYRGNLSIQVDYSLSCPVEGKLSLHITFRAECVQGSREAIFNPTVHPYFHLGPTFPIPPTTPQSHSPTGPGLDPSATVLSHSLLVNSAHYVPVDATLAPSLPPYPSVLNTPFSLICNTQRRKDKKEVGKLLASGALLQDVINEMETCEQVQYAKGIDHTFCLTPSREQIERGKEEASTNLFYSNSLFHTNSIWPIDLSPSPHIAQF